MFIKKSCTLAQQRRKQTKSKSANNALLRESKEEETPKITDTIKNAAQENKKDVVSGTTKQVFLSSFSCRER